MMQPLCSLSRSASHGQGGARRGRAAAWRVVAHTRATRLQKVQHPMGAACAAAPRSLQTLARAGSLKTSSGRSLKILGQNASSWRWRERAPVAPHFLQCTDPRRAALGFAFPRARAPQAASPRSTTSSGASSFEILSEVRREARQWGGARGQAARGGARSTLRPTFPGSGRGRRGQSTRLSGAECRVSARFQAMGVCFRVGGVEVKKPREG